MPWVRSGECPPERCQGQCCTHYGIWFDNLTAATHAEVRGAEVRAYRGRWLADWAQRCQYLTDDNLCALHPDMNPSPDLPARPLICDEGPAEPSQMLLDPNCGFEFTWVEEETGVSA